MVAPLQERPPGVPQALHRSVLIHVAAEVPFRGAAQRPPHAVSRRQQLAVQPRPEHLVVDALGLRFGQHDEERVDSRFDGPLAQQVRTKACGWC